MAPIVGVECSEDHPIHCRYRAGNYYRNQVDQVENRLEGYPSQVKQGGIQLIPLVVHLCFPQQLLVFHLIIFRHAVVSVDQ